MPPTFQLVKPFKLEKLTRVLRVRGVDVYVHWTVFLIAGIMIVSALRQPWLTLTGGASYLALILLHECGHMIAAQKKGCAVFAIELYPIHGRCCHAEPWSRFDHCFIAWGGVIAQAVVAVPLLVWLAIFGFPRFEPVTAILAILGPYSLLMAAFNLMPAGRLDGAIAWSIIPELMKRAKVKMRKKKKPPSSGWRSY